MDTTQLGIITAEFMERVEREYGDLKDARVGDVVLCAEIWYQDEDGDKRMEVTTGSTTDNRAHQSGIAGWGKSLIDDFGNPVYDDDHGED